MTICVFVLNSYLCVNKCYNLIIFNDYDFTLTNTKKIPGQNVLPQKKWPKPGQNVQAKTSRPKRPGQNVQAKTSRPKRPGQNVLGLIVRGQNVRWTNCPTFS